MDDKRKSTPQPQQQAPEPAPEPKKAPRASKPKESGGKLGWPKNAAVEPADRPKPGEVEGTDPDDPTKPMQI